MFSLAKTIRTLSVMLGMAAGVFATSAQAQSTACGVTGISSQVSPVVYDPFNPSGLQSTTVSMSISRINPGGGGKTSDLNFYLQASPQTGTAANGIQIIPRTVSGQGGIDGTGMNIFHDTPVSPVPALLPIGNPPNGFVKLTYNGNPGQADSLTVTFDIIMPANLNINAAQTLSLDAVFACKMQGGSFNNQTQSGTRSNALVFPVTTLSALRTYYAGTALDFHDITNIPAVPPSAVRTDAGNHVVVQSSGAYSVTLSSQNAFKLKKPGAVTVNDEVRYSLKFLGDTVSTATHPNANQTAISHTCMMTGGASVPENLPIQATLVDGGAGKNPSPSYADVLTVTITPLAYATVATDDCGGYTVP